MELSTIEIRINNARANIDKTLKTLERHHLRLEKYKKELDSRGIDYSDVSAAMAAAANESRTDDYWLLGDYGDKLYDIKQNEKKLVELSNKLSQYLELFKKESERQDIPHIPALEEFLAAWKVEADLWYRDKTEAFLKFQAKNKAEVERIRAKYQPSPFLHRKEIEKEEKAAGVDYNTYQERIHRLFGLDVQNLVMELRHGQEAFDKQLESLLNEEVKNKRLDLYYRCTAAVGVITDASGLYVGSNGSLNGYIVGEDGKASVETIVAGGYNIQCRHYRVLVKPVREKASLSDLITDAEKRVSSSQHSKENAALKSTDISSKESFVH